MRRSKCKESICVYGITGVGKTTQTELLVEVVRQVLGPEKIVRLASANADGWSVIQPSVDSGKVKPCWVQSRKYPIQTIDRLTRGWWPADPDDPDSPLLPPDKQPDWETVGGVVFDSGTDYANWIMRDSLLREADSKGSYKIAAEAASHYYSDGATGDETRYASAARGHYGSDQNRMEQFIVQSKDIPDRFVMWTFLEDRGKDPVTKAPVYGPDVIGSAINGMVPSWFGRTVRISVRPPANKIGDPIRRMYLKNHFELGDPVPYLANVRDNVRALLPQYLEGREANLLTLYKRLSESYQRIKEMK